MLGVFGTNEGLVDDPDGIFLPPPKPRLHELFIKKAATSIGIPGNSFTAFYSYKKSIKNVVNVFIVHNVAAVVKYMPIFLLHLH